MDLPVDQGRAITPGTVIERIKLQNESQNLILWIVLAYLQKENVNFIGVDWSILAAGDMGYEYVARNNVPVAGTVLGALVDFLVDQGADVKSFHLMGFSMGAHVVAVAGWAVTRGKIPRISGN